MEATNARSLVAENFGIAIAARMPMITTTINNSMRVNPSLGRNIIQTPLSSQLNKLIGCPAPQPRAPYRCCTSPAIDRGA